MTEAKCRCVFREGAHEWHCGCVGEYNYVHCRDCDEPIWMCAMRCSRCPSCYTAWEASPEHKLQQAIYVRDTLANLKLDRQTPSA